MKTLLAVLLAGNLLGGIVAGAEEVHPLDKHQVEVQEKHKRIEVVALKVYYNEKMYTILIDGSDFDMVTVDDSFENGVVYNLYLDSNNSLAYYTKNAQQDDFDTEHLMYDHELIYSIMDSVNIDEVDLLGEWNNLQGDILESI